MTYRADDNRQLVRDVPLFFGVFFALASTYARIAFLGGGEAWGRVFSLLLFSLYNNCLKLVSFCNGSSLRRLGHSLTFKIVIKKICTLYVEMGVFRCAGNTKGQGVLVLSFIYSQYIYLCKCRMIQL